MDIFQLNNKNYLCIVVYHSKFLVVKKMKGLSAESLISTLKVVFAEYSIPKRVLLDAGSNFISEKCRNVSKSSQYRTSSILIVLPPEQWTGGGMHQVHQMHHEEVHRLLGVTYT